MINSCVDIIFIGGWSEFLLALCGLLFQFICCFCSSEAVEALTSVKDLHVLSCVISYASDLQISFCQSTRPRIENQNLVWHSSSPAEQENTSPKDMSPTVDVELRCTLFSICFSFGAVVITSEWPLIGLISPSSSLAGQLTEHCSAIGGCAAEEEEFV